MSDAHTLYVYKVREVVRVVDGDTYDMILDVGFHQTHAGRFRLAGWDTPELRRGSDYEKAKAREATEYVKDWLSDASLGHLRVRTHKADSFGRWLADVLLVSSRDGAEVANLADDLYDRGLATPWPTRWRDFYDDEGEARDA